MMSDEAKALVVQTRYHAVLWALDELRVATRLLDTPLTFTQAWELQSMASRAIGNTDQVGQRKDAA
jgi:hypothetical protein